MYQLAITIGILLAYFSNAALQHLAVTMLADMDPGRWRWIMVDEVWRSMFGAESIPAALFLFLLLLIPESPRWLAAQRRDDEAEAILSRVVGRDEAGKEMKDIRATLAQESGSLADLLRPGLRIALLIGILLPLASQVSGINVIIYYGPKIFESAGLEISASLGGSVIIGFINMVFTFVAIAVVDRLGRKPLLYVGVIGLIASLVLVGVLYLNEMTNGPLLLVLFTVYIACFAFSLGPIPWIIISEIFPNSIRGRAMSVGTFTIWISCAVVAQTFPWLLENLGPTGTFWLYAILVSPILPVTFFLIPETKGKTLEQIECDWLGEK